MEQSSSLGARGALTRRQYRRNVWAFGADMALFSVAMSFISPTTVLPSFINTLTRSEVIVGLASGLTSGAWLLPQLFVASVVARMPRKKPIMVWAACIGRPLMVLLALVVGLLGTRAPTATLVIVLATLSVFFVIDAIVSVPWFDLVAVALPPRRRGRVLGTAQVVGGVGGIAAGVVVRYVLSDACPLPFPGNFAILYGLAGATFLVSALALGFIHEPPAPTDAKQAPEFRTILRAFPRILLRDRGFQIATTVRLLGSFAGMGSAFYVLYAMGNLGFRAEDVGLFVSAQVVGSLVAGLLMGVIQDRRGPLVHIRTSMIISLVPPVLGLLAAPVASLWQPGLWYIFLLLYFFLGISLGTMGFPFFNWIMEYAPDSDRPLYIGLINTLSAMAMLAPALGGVIVRTFSYQTVFVVALASGLAALLLSARIPSTREANE